MSVFIIKFVFINFVGKTLEKKLSNFVFFHPKLFLLAVIPCDLNTFSTPTLNYKRGRLLEKDPKNFASKLVLFLDILECKFFRVISMRDCMCMHLWQRRNSSKQKLVHSLSLSGSFFPHMQN